MVTLISSFVFAGVLSAYIFLGRSLMRQVNAEGLESRTRTALHYFTLDISSAISITAQNPGAGVTGTQMTLMVPISITNSVPVVYKTDWSLGTTQGMLERSYNGGTYVVLLNSLSSFSFQYFDSTMSTVTAPTTAPGNPQIDIKQVCMTYTSTAGYAPSGSASNYTVVSPLVILKNKATLVDPNSP